MRSRATNSLPIIFTATFVLIRGSIWTTILVRFLKGLILLLVNAILHLSHLCSPLLLVHFLSHDHELLFILFRALIEIIWKNFETITFLIIACIIFWIENNRRSMFFEFFVLPIINYLELLAKIFGRLTVDGFESFSSHLYVLGDTFENVSHFVTVDMWEELK